MRTAVSRRRFTVEEFRRMGEAGIFDEDDRVELLDGQIIEMAAIGSRHAACVRCLLRLLGDRIPRELVLDVQNPVHIDADTELVPDLAILKPRRDLYAAAHPRPGDVVLLVEVADTTLEYDRRSKIPRYGIAGIPETWLVNLPDREVEVFRHPGGESGYRESFQVPEGGTIETSVSPDLAAVIVEVDEILP